MPNDRSDTMVAHAQPMTGDSAVSEERCATEGCNNAGTERFLAGDVGSSYCLSCLAKVKAIRSAPTAVVKPLEWKDAQTPETSPRWKAESPCGEYLIVKNTRDVEFWSPQLGGVTKYWNTLDEAKAAAQADFNARILSCLSSPAPEPIAEPVAWRWRRVEPPRIGWLVGTGRPVIEDEPGWEIQPLYANPPEPKAEAVSDAMMRASIKIAHELAIEVQIGPECDEALEHLIDLLSSLEAALTKEGGK